MTEEFRKLLSQFCLDAEPVNCEAYGCGHINVTFLVTTASGRRYILQKINDRTFPNVDGLMNNIRLVTEHLRKQTDDPRRVLTLVPARNGNVWLRSSGCWRMYDFVEESLCLQQPETDADFYESAVGFGNFQQMLKDFSAGQLCEVLPNFHNTPDRYRRFHESLRLDRAGRAASVGREIDFYLAREEEAGVLQNMLDAGELPLRVTHNDTKLNNVLLDAKTRKALCVIDLDTVMPGTSLYDFGDSIRFGAATAAEDERDLSLVSMSLDRYETYVKGFTAACPGLTDSEMERMPEGAKIMTLECGLRFLTDYLDGDVYFAVHREGQNLDRTRTHIKLVSDMEKKWDAMRGLSRKQ